MILLILVVFVLGSFAPLMKMAAAGSRGAEVVGALEAALFAVGAGLAGFFSLVLWGLKCDESCDENLAPEARSGDWWHSLAAWQWNAQLALAVTVFLAAGAAFALVLSKRHRAALAAVVLALGLFCSWALLVAPLGNAFGI